MCAKRILGMLFVVFFRFVGFLLPLVRFVEMLIIDFFFGPPIAINFCFRSKGFVDWYGFDVWKAFYQLNAESYERMIQLVQGSSLGATIFCAIAFTVVLDSNSDEGLYITAVFAAVSSLIQAQCGFARLAIYASGKAYLLTKGGNYEREKALQNATQGEIVPTVSAQWFVMALEVINLLTQVSYYWMYRASILMLLFVTKKKIGLSKSETYFLGFVIFGFYEILAFSTVFVISFGDYALSKGFGSTINPVTLAHR